MSDQDSVCGEVLEAGLKALIQWPELSHYVSIPATFISELADRFRKLPRRQQKAIESVQDERLALFLRELQETATRTAAGSKEIRLIARQVAAIRRAIAKAQEPRIIRFPGAHVTQVINGSGNVAIGGETITIEHLRVEGRKRLRAPILPETVATDPYKAGYLKYLAKRFNRFKEWEVGKGAMDSRRIYTAYQSSSGIGFGIDNTPLARFEAAVAYLQQRIRNTKLGRIKARQGNRLFSSYEEFVSGDRGDDPHASKN